MRQKAFFTEFTCRFNFCITHSAFSVSVPLCMCMYILISTFFRTKFNGTMFFIFKLLTTLDANRCSAFNTPFRSMRLWYKGFIAYFTNFAFWWMVRIPSVSNKIFVVFIKFNIFNTMTFFAKCNQIGKHVGFFKRIKQIIGNFMMNIKIFLRCTFLAGVIISFKSFFFLFLPIYTSIMRKPTKPECAFITRVKSRLFFPFMEAILATKMILTIFIFPWNDIFFYTTIITTNCNFFYIIRIIRSIPIFTLPFTITGSRTKLTESFSNKIWFNFKGYPTFGAPHFYHSTNNRSQWILNFAFE